MGRAGRRGHSLGTFSLETPPEALPQNHRRTDAEPCLGVRLGVTIKKLFATKSGTGRLHADTDSLHADHHLKIVWLAFQTQGTKKMCTRVT